MEAAPPKYTYLLLGYIWTLYKDFESNLDLRFYVILLTDGLAEQLTEGQTLVVVMDSRMKNLRKCVMHKT